jgi:hypothetical protein
MFAMMLVLATVGHANPERSASDVLLQRSGVAGEKPAGLHACPSETMSCYPGCAQVGEVYACGQQLITSAGGLAEAIIVLAEAEALSIEDFCKKHTVLCTKGGVQNKENEYVRDARLQPDPCEWLRARYDETTGSEREKVRLAQKFLGCRNKQKRKE